jgi:hypothetical protein
MLCTILHTRTMGSPFISRFRPRTDARRDCRALTWRRFRRIAVECGLVGPAATAAPEEHAPHQDGRRPRICASLPQTAFPERHPGRLLHCPPSSVAPAQRSAAQSVELPGIPIRRMRAPASRAIPEQFRIYPVIMPGAAMPPPQTHGRWVTSHVETCCGRDALRRVRRPVPCGTSCFG